MTVFYVDKRGQARELFSRKVIYPLSANEGKIPKLAKKNLKAPPKEPHGLKEEYIRGAFRPAIK